MPRLLRRWALVALVVLTAVVVSACGDEGEFYFGHFNVDGTPKDASEPICYPAPAAAAPNAGAPAPGPACFHW